MVTAPLPVTHAEISRPAPGQYPPPPDTSAVGTSTGHAETLFELFVQLLFASRMLVIEYDCVEAGATCRDAVFALMVCSSPSFHVTVKGAVPVSCTPIVAEPPLQNAPPPLSSAAGFAFAVTVALPLDVPVPQRESVTEVTVYVVVDSGATERQRPLPAFAASVCVTPSDQVTLNGATPLMIAWIDTVALVAGVQIEPPPDTVACAAAALWTVALPLVVPVQPDELRIDFTE